METESEDIRIEKSLVCGLLPTRDTIGLVVSAIVLWSTVGLVPMFIKCFQTSVSCTRWGPHGSSFSYPLTATAYQLSIVGIVLLPFGMRIISKESIMACLPVGVAFGLKYAVSHVALQKTPASVYALLHASTILFIVIFSRLLLAEKMRSSLEVLAFLGVLAGTAISASQELEAVGMLPLLLTLSDCVCGGLLVPLLRKAILVLGGGDPKRALPITCLKALIGAIVVFPIAFFLEGLQSPDYKQTILLFLSASIILIYHGNLSFMCSLAGGISVGIIESAKGIPAFTMTSLMQGIPHTSPAFWAGAVLVLLSAAAFKIARAAHQHLNAKSGTALRMLQSDTMADDDFFLPDQDGGLINPLVRVDRTSSHSSQGSSTTHHHETTSAIRPPSLATLGSSGMIVENNDDDFFTNTSRERASV